jgi:hypothetical protein
MTLPRKLYKYEEFSAQSLENLKAQRIFFGSPIGFNDPYDCALDPIVLKPSKEEAERIRSFYLRDKSIDSSERYGFEKIGTEELRDSFQRAGKKAMTQAVEFFLKCRGVSCFSEKNDDLLMWGHYGGKHKGFCLEFSTEYAPFSTAKQVEYLDSVPNTSVVPFLIEPEFEPIREFFAVKAKSWAYEKEWRVFHEKAGTLYHYEPGSLTGIYFGPKVTYESLEIVALILRGQNPDVKLFRGERSSTEFKVEFTEFRYSTYLESKQIRR